MSTVTVVATVDVSSNPPRVRLDLTDIGATVPSGTVTVNRLDPNGARVPVRTQDGNPLTLTTSGINKVGLLYDYEMPYGAIVQYTTAEDPTSSSGDVSVPVTVPWLVHPGVPALSMPITITDMTALSRTVQQGVYWPMGRSAPIVATDGSRKSPRYSLSLITETDSDRESMTSLVSDAGPLLLNFPVGWGADPQYIAVGDLSEQRANNIPGEPTRTWEMACTVIDRPSGGSQSERTLLDLLDFPTLDSLMANYATFNDLLAGP